MHSDRAFAPPFGLSADDLRSGIEHAAADLVILRHTRIFFTGGTGYLGRWLVASLLTADEVLGLDLRLVLLSRRPERVPLSSGGALELVRGDVTSLPDPGQVDFVVHGAASSSATFGSGEGDPARMAATIVHGTERILEVAVRHSARVLFLSSGAVYGPQSAQVTESSSTAPDSTEPRSAYGNAKRLAETLCAVANTSDASTVTARLFAFVGPGIPLDRHFAAGNFLADAIAGRTITVHGDGTPRRSYLYTGDLPEWCWALLARGRSGTAYNVGSPESITIAELAHRVAALATTPTRVTILESPSPDPASWYVPSTARAASELGLAPRTSLDDALQRTYDWLAVERGTSH